MHDNVCKNPNIRKETALAVFAALNNFPNAVNSGRYRFAAVTFVDDASKAKVHFDWNEFGFNDKTSSSIQQALVNLPLGSRGATVIDTGFELLERTLAEPLTETGFRNWSVPLIIITMTDGDTLMADELINRMAKPEFFSRPDRRTLRYVTKDTLNIIDSNERNYYSNDDAEERIDDVLESLATDGKCKSDGNDANNDAEKGIYQYFCAGAGQIVQQLLQKFLVDVCGVFQGNQQQCEKEP